MLHNTVVLANLQVYCPTGDTYMVKLAGQMRNLFYAYSLSWHEGNLGRVIPNNTLEEFMAQYEELRTTFVDLIGDRDGFDVTLTFVPFPPLIPALRKEADQAVSQSLQKRFDRRLTMLRDALVQEKRFYSSLLEELQKVIEMGMYLKKSMDKKLLSRMRRADRHILQQYTTVDLRRSTSAKEEVISTCGALL